MKALLGCGLLLLAACEANQPPPPPPAEAEVTDGAERIACALDGAGEFKPACAVERAEIEGTLFLTVRHPDGGFRRFEVLTDGRGLAAADGADEAALKIEGDWLEAKVADDRYRFPMTLGGSGGGD